MEMGKRNLMKRSLILGVIAAAAAGCAAQQTVVVESANRDSRVNIIVIHHTAEDFEDSLKVLTQPSSRPVSSHYLLPEPGDPSYQEADLKVFQLVPEEQRAWHAGQSYWKGQAKLNNASIGIEIVNRTWCYRPDDVPAPENSDWPADTICFYPDFAESQIAMLERLLADITARHPEVKPTHIIGHSDIAPQRKIDPGPRFPWQRLYKLGYGAWYDDDTVVRYWERFRKEMPELIVLQKALNSYGYQIEITGEDDSQTRNVVRAFQLHFVPWRVSSEFNPETAAVLYALIDKYYPDELAALLPAIGAEAPDRPGS